MTDIATKSIHRSVQPDIAVPQLKNATPFINRFLAAEWVTFTQVNPADELMDVPQISNPYPLKAFDRTYAKHAFRCLLRVIRLTIRLLHDKCPMVRVAGIASFDEEVLLRRARKVEDLPDVIPNINLDKNVHNPLIGSYCRMEAMERAFDLNNLGKRFIIFLSKAYDKFGPGSDAYHDPEDPHFSWDFNRLFAPAADYGYINSTIHGTALVVTQPVMNAITDENNDQIRSCFPAHIFNKLNDNYSKDEDEDMLLPEEYESLRIKASASPVSSLAYPPSLEGQVENEPITAMAPLAFRNICYDAAKSKNRPPTPHPTFTASTKFAQAEIPVAHTQSGESVLKDKFEDLVKHAYDKGAEHAIDLVREYLTEADRIRELANEVTYSGDYNHAHASPSEHSGRISPEYQPSPSPIPPSYSPTLTTRGPSHLFDHKHRYAPYDHKNRN